MSKYVSLLPAEYRQKLLDEAKQKRMLRVTGLVALGVTVLLLVVLSIRMLMMLGVYNTQKEIDQVSQQISGYSQLEVLQQQMELLQSKVQGVQSKDPQWLDALYQFGQALPQGVWAKSILCAPATETTPRTMTVECGGVVYGDVSKTLLALQECPVVEAVTCTSSTQANPAADNGTSAVSFTLTVTLKGVQPK